MKSWKTTWAGVATLLASVASAASLLLDADTKTNPNWELTMAGIATGIGLIFARDNKVTSRDLGLIKPDGTENTEKKP